MTAIFLPLLALLPLTLDSIVDPLDIERNSHSNSPPLIVLLIVAVVVITALLVRYFRNK